MRDSRDLFTAVRQVDPLAVVVGVVLDEVLLRTIPRHPDDLEGLPGCLEGLVEALKLYRFIR